MRRVLGWVGLALLIALALLITLNLSSLDDGLLYLEDMLGYAPAPARPLAADGRFGFCEQFVNLRNAQRAQFISNYLDGRGIAYERLPIFASGFDNVFVPFADGGPYTLFTAHYDKAFDDPDYEGASDNSAAVCMLLVAAEELVKQPPNRSVGILFTGQEEVGLVGAAAFYEYATQNGLQISEVLNFDNIGRAGLAARASGERSGFVFTLPLLGEYVYDGRSFAPSSPYVQPRPALLDRIGSLVPLTRYDRMIAKSDGTLWQDHGWNTVNLSSDDIYYLDLTWHTFRDRLELLDESNLELALRLVTGYAALAEEKSP
jgi:hypothetical protein